MELQHFCHQEHPLVFNENRIYGKDCFGCREPILGPSYSCIKCSLGYYHHKSCAELPLGLYHPLHPKHPLILFDEFTYRNDNEFSKRALSPLTMRPKDHNHPLACIVCKEFHSEYSYRCSCCDFNIHIICFLIPIEAEFHDHPLTPFCKSIMFTCDICGKEEKGMPNVCLSCGLWIHRRCDYFPRRVKVVRHKHPLYLTHSFLEVDQSSDSRFCQLCVRKVDTHYGLYYCSTCDFVAHLDCATNKINMEYKNLIEFKDEVSSKSKTMPENEDLELDQFIDSTTEIATKIVHFSHTHDLKLMDEIHNNEKCDGCARAILPPFYSCAKCNFFLHKSCFELPKKKRHPLHRHPLTLLQMTPNKFLKCSVCDQYCNGFTYSCETCHFILDVQCSLISDILTHKGHKHQLLLSNTTDKQNCTSCDSKSYQVFRCTTCEFALDFKCATLPHTTRYKQHDEHPFTLCYNVEDDSGEYYCDICEEERDPKHWFYYCADCNYPAHPKCILGKYPNFKFGGTFTFDCHPHPLTFIEETKDHPPCHKCSRPCKELTYQCFPCNFNMHSICLYKSIKH